MTDKTETEAAAKEAEQAAKVAKAKANAAKVVSKKRDTKKSEDPRGELKTVRGFKVYIKG